MSRHGKKSQQVVISWAQFKNGIKMVFLTAPVCDFYPHKMHSKQDSDIIQAEICKLLSKGVIIPTEREDDDFVSNIFTRKKRDDTYRMILNLKKFNDFLLVPHCKLESIEDALNLITECCYFASVDLKDAYYSIPIHEDFQKYLKMYWENYYFKYTVLPNGFAPAVREFTKVLKDIYQ